MDEEELDEEEPEAEDKDSEDCDLGYVQVHRYKQPLSTDEFES